jgi:hypothetical protein
MTFPKLSTGALHQYPAATRIRFSTRVLKHVDGSEQRFPQFASGKREWVLELERLSDEEIGTLREFWADVQDTGGEFAFTDPVDGSVYQRCEFQQSSLELFFEAEERAGCRLVIQQKRED